MGIWRAEGKIKELGPDGYSTIRRESVDGADWEGLASAMARYELNLSKSDPTYFIEWETMLEISTIQPINNYILDLAVAVRKEIYQQYMTDHAEAPQ